MARKSKALRGKRRWIGISVDESITTRKELVTEINDEEFRLYDFKDGIAIIRVPLERYQEAKQRFSNGLLISTTSSGKIKLVRERLQIKKS